MSSILIKRSRSDIVFDIINYFLIISALIIVLYPIMYIVSASFSDPLAVISGKVWMLPVGFSLEGYKAVFQYKLIWQGYANTVFYTVAGTGINIIMVVLAAYPLSRKSFYGKNIFMFMFVFAMMFNGGLIPTYLNIKALGILNTRWAMLLPGALNIWNMIITRTYFMTKIPDEIYDAAQIDGCNEFRFVWRIVIPLSGSILAVMTLFHAVIHWNQYFNALIYLDNQKMFPLQLVLRQILIMSQVTPEMLASLDPTEAAAREALAQLLKYSLIIVASLPVIIMYPFIQKYFVRGIMIGALKG